MTPEIMQQLVRQSKKYARVDYSEDDDMVQAMVESVLESMGKVIPGFDEENMTSRQKIILWRAVKDLYDERDSCGTEKQEMKIAALAMITSEIYEPKGAIPGE